MNLSHLLLVGLGGGLGAIARHGVGIAWRKAGVSGFPWATLSVNVIGSLAMGLLVAWLARKGGHGQENIRLFVAIGFLGGFTTFSSFSLDFMTLMERGQMAGALGYAAASVVLSIGALAIGLALGRAWG